MAFMVCEKREKERMKDSSHHTTGSLSSVCERDSVTLRSSDIQRTYRIRVQPSLTLRSVVHN